MRLPTRRPPPRRAALWPPAFWVTGGARLLADRARDDQFRHQQQPDQGELSARRVGRYGARRALVVPGAASRPVVRGAPQPPVVSAGHGILGPVRGAAVLAQRLGADVRLRPDVSQPVDPDFLPVPLRGRPHGRRPADRAAAAGHADRPGRRLRRPLPRARYRGRAGPGRRRAGRALRDGDCRKHPGQRQAVPPRHVAGLAGAHCDDRLVNHIRRHARRVGAGFGGRTAAPAGGRSGARCSPPASVSSCFTPRSISCANPGRR